MRILIPDDELRAICNERRRLRAEFGEDADIVGRRLQALAVARRLGDIGVRPPHRRRPEPQFGPKAFSVCARSIGRIHFIVPTEAEVANTDEAEVIELTFIGWRK